MAISRAALLLALLATPALAAPRSLPLSAANAEIGFRAYAFGLLPIDGRFARFRGVLEYDDADPQHCRVDVWVEVASLQLPDAALRDDVLSPDLLNAPAFPLLTYSGVCAGEGIAGRLTLHGVTRDLRLAVARDGRGYVAQASLHRTDYGVTGRPLLAGETIRIRVSTTLPLP